MAMHIPFRAKAFRDGSLVLLLSLLALSTTVLGQTRDREDEIVANLAGGRVIIHVANERIIFAAIDQPVETKSVPPRVVDLDSTHIGVLFGASEWQMPADPKPVRLDHNFSRVGAPDPHYQGLYAGQAEQDLEAMGIAFLEKLRPLVSQLHHKLEFSPDEPLFEVVVIGYAPNNYGAEVWDVQYRIEQEQVAMRGEYWQTRILRPRFEQLYPPEGKHAPRTLVEVRYPENAKGTPLAGLIQAGDPGIARLRSNDPRFLKVLDAIEKGQAQKASPADATDFFQAVLPLIANNARYFLGTIEQQRGFNWIVPPDEPVEKHAVDDKSRPPEAPTLRKRPDQ
jgi:hypothetical protein